MREKNDCFFYIIFGPKTQKRKTLNTATKSSFKKHLPEFLSTSLFCYLVLLRK
jgi:hypothetical protein